MTLLEALMQSAPMPGLIRLDGAGDIHMDWELWRQCQERGLEERDLAREERFSAILSAAVTSREGGSATAPMCAGPTSACGAGPSHRTRPWRSSAAQTSFSTAFPGTVRGLPPGTGRRPWTRAS